MQNRKYTNQTKECYSIFFCPHTIDFFCAHNEKNYEIKEYAISAKSDNGAKCGSDADGSALIKLKNVCKPPLSDSTNFQSWMRIVSSRHSAKTNLYLESKKYPTKYPHEYWERSTTHSGKADTRPPLEKWEEC